MSSGSVKVMIARGNRDRNSLRQRQSGQCLRHARNVGRGDAVEMSRHLRVQGSNAFPNWGEDGCDVKTAAKNASRWGKQP